MVPLAQALLELDVAATALANSLGRTDRANEIRAKVKALRVAGHRVLLAELASRPQSIEPAEAVRTVIDAAIGGGMSWTEAAGIFNQASEQRAS